MNAVGVLYSPLSHGTYVDDILFGLAFVVGVAVFLYVFLSDPGDSEH